MKKYIVVKLQFEALHRWSDCDIPEVIFLKYLHRHIFHVVVKWAVDDNNREKEFIMCKRDVEEWITDNWRGRNLDSKSCEDMAEILSRQFTADFVSVFEDNENGAEIWAE